MPLATHQPRLADHNVDARMLILASMALVTGTGGALAAWTLVQLIAIVTNFAWFGRISAAPSQIIDASRRACSSSRSR